MNSIQSNLRNWFLSTKRALPWRETPTPYTVLVSEIMLQQTQVSVVIPYFHRWMAKFPSFEALAKSNEEEVIKCWEGLGYYSRARSLHKAAKYICTHFNGKMPKEENQLREIPGIGPYTVGAMRSFAFHEKAPAIDGNVVRVISRLYGLQENVDTVKGKNIIYQLVEEFLPDHEPWVISEGLIEFGALVCKKVPVCHQCPLKNACKAHLENLTSSIPIKKAKPKITPLYRSVPILMNNGHLLLRRIPEGEIMGGLYEFPYFETDEEGMESDELVEAVQKSLRLSSRVQKKFPLVIHGFTRYKATLTPYLLECDFKSPPEGYFFAKLAEVSTFPFSSGHCKILKLLSYSLMYL